jgi:RNA polymerase sigma-70 factor (ECF subfamily)
LPSAEQLYHDYAPRVYGIARKMVRNDVDAEDVLQDVLLQVVRKLPTFRGDAALPTWLHRMTVNAALSHRRRKAVRDEHRLRHGTDQLLEEGSGAAVAGPEEVALQRELQELLEKALAALPPAYRKAFLLADVDGLPNAAVAARLGLSLGALKSRLHRARARLRHYLARHVEPLASAH